MLIMGGAGFIGSNITERFVHAGWDVKVIDGLLENTGGRKNNLQRVIPQIEFIDSRIEDVDGLGGLIDKCDLIIDCMAWTAHHLALENPEYDLALNVNSHLELIKNLKHYPGKRIIYLGSRGQYGNPDLAEINEETPMTPEDIQGVHKLTAESYFRIYSKFYKFHAISLRFGNCFGENQPVQGDDIGLVGSFIREVLAGREIVVYGSGRRRPLIYVRDLAEIILKLSQRSFSGFSAYNVNGWDILIQDVAKTIIEILGKGSFSLKEIPDHVRKIDVGSAAFNCSKIAKLIGDLPLTSLQTALKDTTDYFRTQLTST